MIIRIDYINYIYVDFWHDAPGRASYENCSPTVWRALCDPVGYAVFALNTSYADADDRTFSSAVLKL